MSVSSTLGYSIDLKQHSTVDRGIKMRKIKKAKDKGKNLYNTQLFYDLRNNCVLIEVNALVQA